MRVHKLNKLRRAPIDLAARLQTMGERSVHNAFHYEVIAFAKATKDKKLETFFKLRLAAIEEMMNGDQLSDSD